MSEDASRPVADVADVVVGTSPEAALPEAEAPVLDHAEIAVDEPAEIAVDLPDEVAPAVPPEIAPAVEVPIPVPPGTLTGAFRAFYDHYGPALCGEPLDRIDEDGMPTQYFRNLALEELEPGVLRLKPLGEEAWLARTGGIAPTAADAELPVSVDLIDRLPCDPARTYPSRPLSDIRYLVIHHTGAPEDVRPHHIAREHVEHNGWPGIGYHYVIGGQGARYRTQDLTVVSYHAAQFNPVAVGIALAGDWSLAAPPPAQLAATAALLAELCVDLGLPLTAIRGHREMVPTSCPGELFLSSWKPRLIALAAERLAADRDQRAAQLVAGAPVGAQSAVVQAEAAPPVAAVQGDVEPALEAGPPSGPAAASTGTGAAA